MFVSKTFCRVLQDMSSRRLHGISSRHLEDAFSVTIFRLPRRRQDVLKKSCEICSKHLHDLLKTSRRRLGRQTIIMLKTYCRRLQDLLEASTFLWKIIKLKYYFLTIYSDLLFKTLKMDFGKKVRIYSYKIIFQFLYFPQKCTCFWQYCLPLNCMPTLIF